MEYYMIALAVVREALGYESLILRETEIAGRGVMVAVTGIR